MNHALLSAVVLLVGCASEPQTPQRSFELPAVAATPQAASTPQANSTPQATSQAAATPQAAPLTVFSQVDRVLSADLDGDGTPALFIAAGDELRWGSWADDAPEPTLVGSYRSAGVLQQWLAADLDGDGRAEVYAAFGLGRGHTEAPLEVVRFARVAGAVVRTPLWTSDGPRNQVTALAAWPRATGGHDLYVGAFEDRFFVRGGVLAREGGEPRWIEGHRLRLGMARAVGDFDGDGAVDVAVGRLYGDSPDQPGDLRVLHAGGESEPIETLRGVRAVGSGDFDGDGRVDLLFGDGWHKNYGKLARFRPSQAIPRGDGGWRTLRFDERSEPYAVEQIGVVAGRLVAGGNGGVLVYARTPEGIKAVGDPHPTSAFGSWTPWMGDRIVVAGAKLRRVPLS